MLQQNVDEACKQNLSFNNNVTVIKIYLFLFNERGISHLQLFFLQ